MSRLRTYRAVADAARAWAVADSRSPFTIEVRFVGGLNEAQQAAFTAAADRWAKVIVGDLPPATVDGQEIDDLRIDAGGIQIDGPDGVLGQATPMVLRPATAGAAAGLPVTGKMEFDAADLAQMEGDGSLLDVITHEMGHVLGFGTLWPNKGLLYGANTDDPVFTGPAALRELEILRPGAPNTGVPVENTGGAGTRDLHWRESVFSGELMTGYLGTAGNPLSRLTVASMADLGYQVDLDAAEPYLLSVMPALRRPGTKLHPDLNPTGPAPVVRS